MAVGCVSVATAHNKANSVDQRQPQYDTVVLATYQEDDYLVKRYMVNVPDDRVSDYSVRYSINVAHLQPNLDDNSEALRALSNSTLVSPSAPSATIDKATPAL